MLERLYELWYEDLETRRRFQLWTILSGFAYGLINSLVLGRSERRVTWETIGVVFFLTVALSVFYCLQRGVAKETAKVPLTYGHLSDLFHQHRQLFEVGLASLALLVAGFLAASLPQFGVQSVVQAAGSDMRLRRVVFSSKPSDANTISELTTIFDKARADQVSLSPNLVTVAGEKVTKAYRASPGAWPAALAMLNYRSSMNKESPTYPRVNCIGGSHITVEHVTLDNCGPILDNGVWRNVVVKNSTVVYHGGPVVLQNVRFQNCQFSFDYTPASQQLTKALLSSDTVTITLP
jgi:hypothetical protein